SGEVGVVRARGGAVGPAAVDRRPPPPTSSPPSLSGGAPLGAFVDLPPGEAVLCLTTFAATSPALALGTAQGVDKRVLPEHLSNRDEWEVIGLKDGDAVVGAVELRTGD